MVRSIVRCIPLIFVGCMLLVFPLPIVSVPVSAQDSPDYCERLDIAFVLDTTGSMGGVIDDLKMGMDNLVTEIENIPSLDYQMALITFDDNVYVLEDLQSGNAATISTAINNLLALGGGNGPEASDEALNTAVNRLRASDRQVGDQIGDFTGTWRPDATKIIVLITDTVPGGFDDRYTDEDVTHAQVLAEQARANGIFIVPIFVPGDHSARPIMENYATVTGGIFYETNADGSGAFLAIEEVVTECPLDSPSPIPSPSPTPAPIVDFATVCNIEGGWYGEYSSTRSVEGLDEPPLPILVGVTQPGDERLRRSPYYGLWGSGYFGSGLSSGNNAILLQNPTYYTCDDDLNYNWRTPLRPTDTFDNHYASLGEPEDATIYDLNNVNLATGERRAYLGTDSWAAHWRKDHTFDPDGDGSNGCLTTKVSGSGGGGVDEICIPGLHLIRMSVNDGGRWFLNGGVPDTRHGWGANRIVTLFLSDDTFDLFWYDAFQDRKEVVDIGYVLFTEQYANDLGISRTTPFEAQVDVEYYEKDGRASISFFIDPFTDANRQSLLAPYLDARVANAVMQSDVWDGVVIPEDMVTLPPLDEGTLPQPEQPQPGPLGPIVQTVYLPVIGR